MLAEFEYHHPVFDAAAIAAQRRRAEIQGRRGIFFAGAYWGYGFHEDGVQSALEVVRRSSRAMTAILAPTPSMTSHASAAFHATAGRRDLQGTVAHRRFAPRA